jgi:hypothetical protein
MLSRGWHPATVASYCESCMRSLDASILKTAAAAAAAAAAIEKRTGE